MSGSQDSDLPRYSEAAANSSELIDSMAMYNPSIAPSKSWLFRPDILVKIRVVNGSASLARTPSNPVQGCPLRVQLHMVYNHVDGIILLAHIGSFLLEEDGRNLLQPSRIS